MRRRVFLGGLAVSTLAVGCLRWWPDEGLWNPCLMDSLPAHLADHELVRAAWEGVQAPDVWDSHVHLIGLGNNDSGVWVNPAMRSLWNPVQYTQFKYYLNASCTTDNGQADHDYVTRLLGLLGVMPPGAKAMLLAFDYHYTETGERVIDLSPFHTPNEYAARLAQEYPQRFEWIASIHPYRTDCVEALEWAVQQGAQAVKWLPPAMGMDPASPLCDRFYAAMVRLNVPLLSHGGDEHAVRGEGAQALGNPLKLRRALDHGVRVIVAHCATQGEGVDLDQGTDGPRVKNFLLFARMMDEARYQDLLFGDISAMPQINRAGYLRELLIRGDWHNRLLNGSDYPLPGVMPLFSLRRLVADGLLTQTVAEVCSAVRRYHPLLFDYLLKRHLQAGEARFAAGVFETRRFFNSAAAGRRV